MKPRTIPTELDALLTEHEAAYLLGISVRTLQAWRTRNSGPPFARLGRLVRYRRSMLEDWTKSNTQTAASS